MPWINKLQCIQTYTHKLGSQEFQPIPYSFRSPHWSTNSLQVLMNINQKKDKHFLFIPARCVYAIIACQLGRKYLLRLLEKESTKIATRERPKWSEMEARVMKGDKIKPICEDGIFLISFFPWQKVMSDVLVLLWLKTNKNLSSFSPSHFPFFLSVWFHVCCRRIRLNEHLWQRSRATLGCRVLTLHLLGTQPPRSLPTAVCYPRSMSSYCRPWPVAALLTEMPSRSGYLLILLGYFILVLE